MRMHDFLRRCSGAAAALACAVLGACGPYTIKGRVVQGDTSYVSVVEQGDSRLGASPVAGAQVRLRMDPGKLNRKTLAQEVSDGNGDFTLPVDEFGAGILEFDLGLVARRKGFVSAEGFFRLPPGSRRVLIVLAPGQDPAGYAEEPASLSDEAERWK